MSKIGKKVNPDTEYSSSEISFIDESWLELLARKKRELQYKAPGPGANHVIAVFGSSRTKPGTREWDNAHRVGREIARCRALVINGGYGGVMVASAEGARSADGIAIGVTCTNIPDRVPNPHLSVEWCLKRWDQRLLALVWLADAYVVLPGSSGTLVELSMVIETQLKGFLPARPTACLGDYWKPVVKRIDGSSGLVRFFSKPQSCIDHVLG